MKTIFIMGILSFFCGISAAQPQYWGEGAYDLENVEFGMKVDKYYSKAKPYDGDYDESFRYFMKEALCDHIQGYAGGEKRAATASLCIGHGIHEYDCRMDERASRSN